MPELPEVETISRQLNTVLSGKVIGKVLVRHEKSFRGDISDLSDRKIARVRRRAKMMIVEFDATDFVLMIHLKMTGQLIYLGLDERVVGGHPTDDWVGTLPSRHTRIEIHFADESALYFNDQRLFGWVRVVPLNVLFQLEAALPPDVTDAAFTPAYLRSLLGRSARAVKLVVMDSAKIGGAGNIYANDALFLAGINPRRKANAVRPKEVERLHAALQEVIAKGIETGGASYSHFVDTKGLGGHYQEHFLVYDQEGKPCPNGCGDEIRKTQIGGRGTYWCPTCQR